MGGVGEEERVGRAGGLLVDQPVRRRDAVYLRHSPGRPAVHPRPGDGPVRLRPEPDAGVKSPPPGGEASSTPGGVEGRRHGTPWAKAGSLRCASLSGDSQAHRTGRVISRGGRHGRAGARWMGQAWRSGSCRARSDGGAAGSRGYDDRFGGEAEKFLDGQADVGGAHQGLADEDRGDPCGFEPFDVVAGTDAALADERDVGRGSCRGAGRSGRGR